jgi:type IV pilus assembly protein PilC
MIEYQYSGVDKAGKKISGKLDAPTEGDLRMSLRAQGIRPTKISKAAKAGKGIMASLQRTTVSVKLETLVAFTRQLQVLIGSGIPLVQGLEVLSDQGMDPSLRAVVIAIREKVSQGSYLWEALSAYPTVFSKLYVSLIRAGEASGSMDSMLKRLSRYMEDSDRVRKMVKSAMMYPIIVISIGSIVVSLMLVFVVPKFEDMLKNAGQQLPMPTQVVISMSHFLADNILYIIGVLAVAGFAVSQYLGTDEGRAFQDRVVFRLPVFGELAQKSGVARFCRTMQTLLMSGVNLIDAIDICKTTIDNAVLEEAVSKIRAEVESGKTLGMVVSKIGVFPKMAVQMIVVGESTGNLDKMLEKVADFYEGEVETLVGGLTKLIEPFVLLFLGVSVGGIMIAMYLPIFQIAGSTE